MSKQFKRGDRVKITHGAFDEDCYGEVNRTCPTTGAVNVFIDGTDLGTWFQPEYIELTKETENV